MTDGNPPHADVVAGPTRDDDTAARHADRGKHPLEHLCPEDLPDLVADLRKALDSVEATGSVRELVVELSAWVATAEIHADPELMAAINTPVEDLDEYVEVPRPQ